MILRTQCFVALLFSFVCMPCLYAQTPDTEVDAVTQNRAEELYKVFEKTATGLDIKPATNDRPYKFDPKPLLRFASEGTVFGTVHVWKDADSRLAVIGTIGSIPINDQDYEFVELHLLRPEQIAPLQIAGFPSKTWAPEIDSLKFQSLSKSPPVAESDRRRLVQMRGIARQFSVEMTNQGNTNQLRLLPEPLFRYANSSAEKDGALFAFVWDTGTDPELLLRIESTKTPNGITWHYQSVRFTYRALKLMHNKIQVWEVDEFTQRDQSAQNTPYVTGLTKSLD